MDKVTDIILLVVLLLFNSCSASQMPADKMKSTTQKFITYLKNNDTSNIHSLFKNEENYKGNEDLLSRYSSVFKKVIALYKIPPKDQWQIQKGPYGENVVRIAILNKDDTTLNIKRFELLVYFLPDQFLEDADQIDNFFIIRIPVKEEEKKLQLNPKFD